MRVRHGTALIARGILRATLLVALLAGPTLPVSINYQPTLAHAEDCLEAVKAEGASEAEAIGYCAAALGNGDAAVLAYRTAVGLTQATVGVIDSAIDIVDEVVKGDLEDAADSGGEALDEAGAALSVVVGFVQIVFSNPGRITEAQELRDAAKAEQEQSQQAKEEAQEALVAIILSKCPSVSLKNPRIVQRTRAVNEALMDRAVASTASEGTLEFLISMASKLKVSSNSKVCSERSAPARPTATSTPQRVPAQQRVVPIRATPTRMPIPDSPDFVPPGLTR
jgi:hypothetical protein